MLQNASSSLTLSFAASLGQRAHAAGSYGASQRASGTDKAAPKKDFLQAFEQAADKAVDTAADTAALNPEEAPGLTVKDEAPKPEEETPDPAAELLAVTTPPVADVPADAAATGMVPMAEAATTETVPMAEAAPIAEAVPLAEVIPMTESARAALVPDTLPAPEIPAVPAETAMAAAPEVLADEGAKMSVPASEATQQDVGIIEGFDLLQATKQPAATPAQQPLDHANAADAQILIEHLEVVTTGEPAGETNEHADDAQSEPAQTHAAPAITPEVRVFAAPQQAEAAQPEPRVSVTQQIVQAVQIERAQDSYTFNLQLRPESLGRVQIELVLTKDGLSAQIKTADAAARGLISAELDTLQQALKDKGIQVVQMDVIYEQTMQDMARFSFSRNGRDQARGGSRSSAADVSGGAAGGMKPAVEAALTASSMYDTASVEYSA